MNAAIRVVRARIIADSQLATILATDTGHAVRPGDASEVDAPPYVLLWTIVDRPVYAMGARTGISRAVIQVDCYAETKGQAALIASLIADALDGTRGIVGDVWVNELIQEDSRDRDERTAEGADKPLAVVQTDYRITYRG